MSLFFLDQKNPIAQVDCLSINTGQSNLLVPMPAIAEIILNQGLIADEGKPQWMCGWIKWRNLTIPLIDFAALQQAKPWSDFGSSTRIVVLKQSGGRAMNIATTRLCAKASRILLELKKTVLCRLRTKWKSPPASVLSFDLDGQHLDLPDFEEIETHLRSIPHNQ